jgi:phosphoglycolate phosphatase
MTKLIIFDLDGTLLNTIEDLANSANYALSRFGFPEHPKRAYNYFVGNGINKLLERALPETLRNEEVISMVKHEFIKHYFANIDKCTKPYDGVAELLQRLAKEGYRLAVASNKVHDATVKLVKKYFPDSNFVEILGQREGIPVKPHPSIVEEIVKKAAVSKDEVLYVGDSGVDVQTAQNAAVRFVGVLWGFRPKEELQQVGAKVFAQNAADLEAIIRAENK